ncbi:MAG: GDYXXLXY domain-containing protein [Methanosarcina sp.]|uniref:GDYXXLXY domain-containing protein n=1 Tax=Methanosarcina sp. TaxID=2213 RepID=UPI002610C724|nr:GDYXXLXY domain-containing protein [Methanosarcina sp.]MDD3246344.1 GDYXXLXY domain-containing protein [Methanosarcina sp.]MDD4250179.1 GDYXXLXY domain-containing protein [Methanosarcina sp.]
MNQKKIFYLTIVFWLMLFSGFILYKEYTLRTGTEVVLKTEPVDPRDLFRGDYVILNYDISTLDLDEVPVEDPYFNHNDRIYLAIELEDGYGVPKKVYRNPPGDELYLKGTVKELIYDWGEDEDGIITEEPHIKELRVEYGIESYFVPEGRGIEIESQQWTGEEGVDVKVVVDKYGNAVIKSLLIGGQEVEI